MRPPGDEMVSLRDGSKIRLRHVAAGDADALVVFMRSLSPKSRRLRFFGAGCDIDAAASWAAEADGAQHIGLVAVDSGGKIVGHAACVRLDGPRGEVAVEVDESHRHLGLATLLLKRLGSDGERHGIRQMVAEVLPENLEMLSVFYDEFHATGRSEEGEVDLEFPSSASHLTPPGRLE